jgi:protein-tyrosine phosphatase
VGDPPDPRTIRNALKNGVSLQHVGRQLAATDFETYDWILAMDESNYHTILRHEAADGVTHKIKQIREFDPEGPGDVPDPYYGYEKDFQLVFDILDRSIESFIRQIDRA